MKTNKILLFMLLSVMPVISYAQLTYGQTGLLHIPSGEMQQDKTVMIGANLMNKNLTPKTWYYNTYNYFVNATLFPFLELNYACTMFKSEQLGIDWKTGKGKFTNQDRYFGARLRLLKEGQIWKYMPSIVIGTTDPYSGASEKLNPTEGNGYFCRFYAAATKKIKFHDESVGLTVAYLYNRRNEYPLNGVACGISYNPSFIHNFRLIAEYDTKDIAIGATYLLFKSVHFQAEMQKMKYFSGGITYKIHLK